jgi:hypothetical protein
MSQSSWEMYVDGCALVAVFREDMPVEDDVFARVNEEFEALASQSEVDTHVSVLRMDSPMGSAVFERAQEAARIGTEFGIDHWIVVSEDLKSIALRGRVGEIEGVEVDTTDSVDEALAMAEANQ